MCGERSASATSPSICAGAGSVCAPLWSSEFDGGQDPRAIATVGGAPARGLASRRLGAIVRVIPSEPAAHHCVVAEYSTVEAVLSRDALTLDGADVQARLTPRRSVILL
jgi:hypothetical protein